MVKVAFDTLKMAERLEAAEFTWKQAKALVEVWADVISDDRVKLATKVDLEDQQMEMLAAIAKAKTDLTRWVVGAGVLQMALIVTLAIT